MTPEQILALLKTLPRRSQREEVRQRIDMALKNGWTEIRLDAPDGWPPDAADLIGRRPSDDLPTLLPDVNHETETS